MSRILQGVFLVDTTVSFQRQFNLPEPLRSVSFMNISTVTLSISLGSNDVLFFSLPATTAIDIDALDFAIMDEDIVKFSITAPTTAPAGTNISILAILSRKRITLGLAGK